MLHPMRMALWVAVCSLLMVSVTVAAGEPDPREISHITSQVSEKIESPYCPGQSLAMCPSANAAETRRDIQRMAEQGMSAEEIKVTLIERYGEGYELIEPPVSDQMTLLGGIVGGLAIAIGVVSLLAKRRFEDDEDGGQPQSDPAGGDGDDLPDDVDDELYLEELRAEYRD